MLPRRCNMIKANIRAELVALGQLSMTSFALGQVIMTSLAKQFMAPQILSIMKLKTLGTDVYFTNSLNHGPQHHCDKKATITPATPHPGNNRSMFGCSR